MRAAVAIWFSCCVVMSWPGSPGGVQVLEASVRPPAKSTQPSCDWRPVVALRQPASVIIEQDTVAATIRGRLLQASDAGLVVETAGAPTAIDRRSTARITVMMPGAVRTSAGRGALIGAAVAMATVVLARSHSVQFDLLELSGNMELGAAIGALTGRGKPRGRVLYQCDRNSSPEFDLHSWTSRDTRALAAADIMPASAEERYAARVRHPVAARLFLKPTSRFCSCRGGVDRMSTRSAR